MASYSLVHPYNLKDLETPLPPSYAIVASDEEAHYVFKAGAEVVGLDDARLERLVKMTKTAPTTALEWLRVFNRVLLLVRAGRNRNACRSRKSSPNSLIIYFCGKITPRHLSRSTLC